MERRAGGRTDGWKGAQSMYVNHVLTSIDGLHAVRPRDVAARHHPGGQGGAGELPAQLVACKGGTE